MLGQPNSIFGGSGELPNARLRGTGYGPQQPGVKSDSDAMWSPREAAASVRRNNRLQVRRDARLQGLSQQLAWLALAAAIRNVAEIPANPVHLQQGLVPAIAYGIWRTGENQPDL
jgi:hypothetical protein